MKSRICKREIGQVGGRDAKGVTVYIYLADVGIPPLSSFSYCWLEGLEFLTGGTRGSKPFLLYIYFLFALFRRSICLGGFAFDSFFLLSPYLSCLSSWF